MNPDIHGLMAEFDGPTELLTAARQTYAAGYRHVDAYSPFPVEGLSKAIGFRRTRLPLIVLLGGLFGMLGGFGMQYWIAAIDYPLNIGGKPPNSWPAFIPITFEMTILFASIAAVVGMIVLNGLPKPYNPVFNVERFELASRDRFFLCVEATDPMFDLQATGRFLQSLTSHEIAEVPN